jgi:hypothetical protein
LKIPEQIQERCAEEPRENGMLVAFGRPVVPDVSFTTRVSERLKTARK